MDLVLWWGTCRYSPTTFFVFCPRSESAGSISARQARAPKRFVAKLTRTDQTAKGRERICPTSAPRGEGSVVASARRGAPNSHGKVRTTVREVLESDAVRRWFG